MNRGEVRRVTRVLIVDDHPVVQHGVRLILANEPGVTVVGHAGSCAEALRLAVVERPDVVLLDPELPDGDGLQLLRGLNSAGNQCRFVVFTSRTVPGWVREALLAGIHGYLRKDASPGELVRCVRAVGQGRRYYDAEVVEALVGPALHPAPLESLTSREWQVFRALGEGKSNREIASELVISYHTAKKHVSNILSKLGVCDRTRAALWAAWCWERKGFPACQARAIDPGEAIPEAAPKLAGESGPFSSRGQAQQRQRQGGSRGGASQGNPEVACRQIPHDPRRKNG